MVTRVVSVGQDAIAKRQRSNGSMAISITIAEDVNGPKRYKFPHIDEAGNVERQKV